MALSNWDTLAIEFKIETWVDHSDQNALLLNNKISKRLDQLQKENPNEDAFADIFINDEEFNDLIKQEREAKHRHKLEVNISNGCWNFNDDITISIRKNWAYLESEKMWRENSGYVRPIIMKINEGDLSFNRINIKSWRCGQDGIALLAYDTNYVNNGKKDGRVIHNGIIAIGVYGYEGDDFVGVTRKTLSEVEEKLSDENMPNFTKFIKLTNSKRFNQGDKFFAEHLGAEIPMSRVDTISDPLLKEILSDE